MYFPCVAVPQAVFSFFISGREKSLLSRGQKTDVEVQGLQMAVGYFLSV